MKSLPVKPIIDFSDLEKIDIRVGTIENIEDIENPNCEAEIKKDTKATTRCLPLDAPEEEGKCIHCGQPSHHRWIFGLSY